MIQSQKIVYEDKNIVNTTIARAVILPFIEISDYPYPWPQDAKNTFQNTMADALFCEVQRIFPDSIPHYVVEQKIGKVLQNNCYHSKECISYLKDKLGDSVFIFGEMYIQKVQIDSSSLTVYVYNPKTDQVKDFHFFQSYNYTLSSLMKDLLSHVFDEKGLWEYLINM